jgi:hypothetical protein
MTTRPYRPSNGTEGDLFHSWFCFRCQHDSEDNPCDILTRTFALPLGDPEYPAEWIEDDVSWPQNSNPRCTAFLAIEVEGSTYVKDERQGELTL